MTIHMYQNSQFAANTKRADADTTSAARARWWCAVVVIISLFCVNQKHTHQEHSTPRDRMLVAQRQVHRDDVCVGAMWRHVT